MYLSGFLQQELASYPIRRMYSETSSLSLYLCCMSLLFSIETLFFLWYCLVPIVYPFKIQYIFLIYVHIYISYVRAYMSRCQTVLSLTKKLSHRNGSDVCFYFVKWSRLRTFQNPPCVFICTRMIQKISSCFESLSQKSKDRYMALM